MGQELKKGLLAQRDYIEKLKYALCDDFAHPEMVFVSARGNYRDRNSVYQSLKRFTKGTEFEDMTLHQLRHLNPPFSHISKATLLRHFIPLHPKQSCRHLIAGLFLYHIILFVQL